MSFGQPLWFWAFALLPLLLGIFFRNERRREKLLRQLVAARLQDRLAGNVSVPRRRWRFLLLLLGLACVIVSLAQPRLGYTWEQTKRKGRDVLIAIDCSRSMLATDLAPNRLGRAKLAAQDLIGQLQGDRLGLIAFAGSAFLQAPLTIDYGAVLNSLAELDTNIIPRGGTDIAAAIKEAVEAFGKGESDNRCLIIFTDGEELDTDGVTAAGAQNGQVKIFTVGLGSTDGSLIPVPGQDGGTAFVKDESGQIVKSRLDEDRLRKIAESTGGFYVHLLNGPAEMQQIVRTGLGQMKEKEIDARMSRRPIERYQWPLAAGLVLLVASTLIGERKRVERRKVSALAAAAALVLALLNPAEVAAKNSGLEAYEREDYKGAMDEFGRQLQRRHDSEALHFDLGAAAYKAGDFGQALEAFAKAVTSPDPQLRTAAEYNLGNTLFQRGVAVPDQDKARKLQEWKGALQHYEQALKVAPQNKNAEYNRDVVRKLIEELEKEPPKSDEQKKDDQKKDEQKKDDKDQRQKKDQKSQSDKNDKGEKKDQQKDQQKNQQNQPSKGDQQDQQKQEQPGDAQPDKDQQEKDQQSKDGKDGKDEKKDQNQPQPGDKGDEKKDAKNDPATDGKDGAQPQDGKKGEPATPSPDQPDKKHSGEIQAPGQQPQQADPQQEAAAEAQAAAEGKMTEAQAVNLLDSLKNEDDRVRLFKAERKLGGRTFRDW